jgi:GTP-binding protein
MLGGLNPTQKTGKKCRPGSVRRRLIYQEHVVRSISDVERLLRQAAFQVSAAKLSGLPADRGREVAFAGRSNAGKSSALNAITDHKGLARVSKTPGRTQLINFFRIDEERALIDLPGYGYAQADNETRAGWDVLLGGYLESRHALRGVIVLMDIRHPLTPLDLALLEFCAHHQRPVHVLLTKSDKLGHGAQQAALQSLRARLGLLPGQFSAQLFSATRPSGVDEARAKISDWLAIGNSPDEKKPRTQGERVRGI